MMEQCLEAKASSRPMGQMVPRPQLFTSCVELQGLMRVVHSSTMGLFAVAATLCSLPWLFMVPEPRRGLRLWPSKHSTELLNGCLRLANEELFAMSIPPTKVVPVWDRISSSKTAQGQRAIAATCSSHSQGLLSLT